MARNVSADYTREITVRVSAERLFDAIATVEGVRGWWTPLVSGSDRTGGTMRLAFSGLDEHIDLRVLSVERPTRVEWSVVEHTALEEWDGTRIGFEVAPAGAGASRLAFRHEGLSPKLECFDQCEAGWDHFLASLVAFVEHGRGEPFGSGRRGR